LGKRKNTKIRKQNWKIKNEKSRNDFAEEGMRTELNRDSSHKNQEKKEVSHKIHKDNHHK